MEDYHSDYQEGAIPLIASKIINIDAYSKNKIIDYVLIKDDS